MICTTLLVGCEAGDQNVIGTPVIREWCYGGVVYLEKSGQTNTSVKFKPDSTVATETFDGVKCYE